MPCCPEALPKRLLALTKSVHVVFACFCLTLHSIMCFQWSVLSQGWLLFTVVTVTDVCLRSALYDTAFILNLCLEALWFLSSRDSVSRLCSTDIFSDWFRRLQMHGLVVSIEEICYIVWFAWVVQIYFNAALQLICLVMKQQQGGNHDEATHSMQIKKKEVNVIYFKFYLILKAVNFCNFESSGFQFLGFLSLFIGTKIQYKHITNI